MQGTGTKGKFCGQNDSIESSKIVILPIAFDQTTTYCHGAEKGPEALIEASRHVELYDIPTASGVYRKGIYTAPILRANSSIEMLKRSYEEVSRYLDMKKFVVTLGGEHSISFSPIRAHAERFVPISVLQFDAHADLVDQYEKNRWSHACVMARVKEITHVKKIVSVGIRSMSEEEGKVVDKENTFFAHDLHRSDAWMDEVVKKLTDYVYITFDLDCFDSSVMPSTGTPEPGGLFYHQVIRLFEKIAQKRQIIGCDIVELCPIPFLIAPDFLSAKLLYQLLSIIFRE